MIGQVSSLNGIGGGGGKDMKGELAPRGKLQKHFFSKLIISWYHL